MPGSAKVADSVARRGLTFVSSQGALCRTVPSASIARMPSASDFGPENGPFAAGRHRRGREETRARLNGPVRCLHPLVRDCGRWMYTAVS